MKQTVSLTLLHTCTLRIPRSPPCAKLTKDNLEATTVTMITITSTAIFPSATPRISIHFTVLHAGKYKGWGGERKEWRNKFTHQRSLYVSFSV